MSFQCGICHKQTAPGEKATRIVLTVRTVRYPFRGRVHRYVNPETKLVEWRDDPGGIGHETATECLACTGCAQRRLQNAQPAS